MIVEVNTATEVDEAQGVLLSPVAVTGVVLIQYGISTKTIVTEDVET